MSRRRQLHTVWLLALAFAVLAPVLPGHADPPPPDDHPGNSPGASSSGSEVNQEDYLEELAITPVQEAFPTYGDDGTPNGSACNRQPPTTPREGPPAGDTVKRTIFVYVVPSDGLDEFLDVPVFCSNGTSYSVGHRVYRNLSTYMRREAQNWTDLSPVRLQNVTKTYAHPFTGQLVTLNSMSFLRSTRSTGSWNALTDQGAWDALKTELRANGYNHNGYPSRQFNYVAILSANSRSQFCGWGAFNTPGTVDAYAMVYRQCFSTNDDGTAGPTATVRFGCATAGDRLVMHETTHVLGTGHTGDVNDIMCGAPQSTSCVGGQTFKDTTPPQLDHGANTYRVNAFGRGWGVATYFKVTTPYHTCP